MTRMKIKIRDKRLASDMDKKFERQASKKGEVKIVAVDLPPGCETEIGRQMRRGLVKAKKEMLIQDRG